MKNKHIPFKEWVGQMLFICMFRKWYVFPIVHLVLDGLEGNGSILDIGGGGEGVIGRWKGDQVVAIDLRKDELDEAPGGFQKVVMDARQMDFPDGSFQAATAFFSMMYMKTREDHLMVMKEAWRVLKPGGSFHLWDVDLSFRRDTRKEKYLVRLRYQVGDYTKGTAYGARWPAETRDVTYYTRLARDAGFQHRATDRLDHIFHISFFK
jgi:SAM-dependent methyltransferase